MHFREENHQSLSAGLLNPLDAFGLASYSEKKWEAKGNVVILSSRQEKKGPKYSQQMDFRWAKE